MTTSYCASTIIPLCGEYYGPAARLSREALRAGKVVGDLDRLAAFRAKIQGAAGVSVKVHSHALGVLDTSLAAGRRILVRRALTLPQVLSVETVTVTDRREVHDEVGRGALG